MLDEKTANFNDEDIKRIICKFSKYDLNDPEIKKELKTYGIEIIRGKMRVSDDIIYYLREQGLTYKAIVEKIQGYGLDICFDTVAKRCRKVYAKKGKNTPCLSKNISLPTIYKSNKQKVNIFPYQQLDNQTRRKFNTIIYNLKKLGLSNSNIKKEIEKYGIDIKESTISTICKRMFPSKNEEFQNGNKMFESLYNLTNGNINYSEILTKLEEEHITVSNDIKYKINIYTLVYKLKKQGLSCANILDELNKQGIITTDRAIREICFEIYELESKSEAFIDCGSKTLDEKIYEFREQGICYQKISDKLKENGIILSRQGVEQRYKRYLKFIYDKKEGKCKNV